MNQVILASHGELALGALDTIRMIVGEVPNVHAVILRRDDTEPITGKVEALIDGFADEDDVFVLTDMLGSSVNNAMVELMARRPRVRVVSGMNMPLVLTLVLGDAKVTPSELRSVIGDARAGIVACANPDVSQAVTSPAPAAVSGAVSSAGSVLMSILCRVRTAPCSTAIRRFVNGPLLPSIVAVAPLFTVTVPLASGGRK